MKAILFYFLIALTLFCNILWGGKYFYRKGKVARLEGSKRQLPHVSLQTNCPGKMRVILIGDSRIQQWGAPIFGEQIESYNLGTSGATSAEVLCLVADDIVQIRADWFIVQVGINDIVAASMQSQEMRNQTIKNLLENLRKIIHQLGKTGSRVIVLTLVPPISPDIIRIFLWGGSAIDEAVEQVSGEIVDEFSRDILVYDMKQLFFDREHSRWKKQYATDALHWSQEGYDHLTYEIRKLLLRSI